MEEWLMATENAKRMHTDDASNARDWDAFDRLPDPECVVYWPDRAADPTHGGQDHHAEAIAFCDAFPDNKVKNTWTTLSSPPRGLRPLSLAARSLKGVRQ
jgi:hypothetical protein